MNTILLAPLATRAVLTPLHATRTSTALLEKLSNQKVPRQDSNNTLDPFLIEVNNSVGEVAMQ